MKYSIQIEDIWKTFDEGFKHSNEKILVEKMLRLLSAHDGISNQDITMYKKYADLLNDDGFLIKEEKQFLINYFILLIGAESVYLRNCASVLDVWPDKQGIRTDFIKGTYRKEALLWFIRMYEVLGNYFLQRRGHTTYYSGMELAHKLEDEKCKLKENEYNGVKSFLGMAETLLNGGAVDKNSEQDLKAMRKFIWKINEGINKYLQKCSTTITSTPTRE